MLWYVICLGLVLTYIGSGLLDGQIRPILEYIGRLTRFTIPFLLRYLRDWIKGIVIVPLVCNHGKEVVCLVNVIMLLLGLFWCYSFAGKILILPKFEVGSKKSATIPFFCGRLLMWLITSNNQSSNIVILIHSRFFLLIVGFTII